MELSWWRYVLLKNVFMRYVFKVAEKKQGKEESLVWGLES